MGEFITRDGNQLYAADSVEADGYFILVARAYALTVPEGCEDLGIAVTETALGLEELLPTGDDFDVASIPADIPGSEDGYAFPGWNDDAQLSVLMAQYPHGMLIPAPMKATFDELAKHVLQLESGTCTPIMRYAGVAAALVSVPLLAGAIYYIWRRAS